MGARNRGGEGKRTRSSRRRCGTSTLFRGVVAGCEEGAPSLQAPLPYRFIEGDDVVLDVRLRDDQLMAGRRRLGV